MIYSEGYKAFRGTMRIVPKNSNTKPYELTADWLYKPEYQCWYGRSSSFPEEICEVLADLTTPPANPPLTPDQLREMDGEPVWIRTKYDASKSFWAIVNTKGDQVESYARVELFEDYWSDWLAYRRKPEV